jgi:hypothetical protein
MKQIVIFLLLVINSFAITISGIGFANNENEAKKLALEDLSHNISVIVQSDYTSFIDKNDKSYNKKINKLINIKSELPIISASFSYSDTTLTATATIDSKTALQIYIQKLNDLSNDINKAMDAFEKAKNNTEKYNMLELANELAQSYEKYEIVALMLGYKKDTNIHQISSSEITAKMITLASSIDSIELATKIISQTFKNYKNICVFAPVANGSNEITPFGVAIKDNLNSKINQSKFIDSLYTLTGSYELSENDSIFLTYTLIDKTNNPITSKSVLLDKNSYGSLRAKPNNLSFDNEIELAKDKLRSELIVDLSFKDTSNKSLLLRKNQEVALVAKSNRQSYFYIVGHILHENEQYSYLVELQEANANERFVYTIGATNVNKPILLPLNFVISEPFGYESLQMFASTNYPANLPKCQMKNGLCVISNNPNDTVSNTRAIKAIKQSELKAEANLSFTTAP